MKRELALQLLGTILPDPPWNEAEFQTFFRELEVLSENKYNAYEMYHPGRLFFENLYLWLLRFKKEERTVALEFVRNELIFVSRTEFQQLAQVLYSDLIYQKHLDIVSQTTGISRFRVRMLAESDELRRIKRSSLYVALSDGARIGYFRRQNLGINNEQVLPIYYPSQEKKDSLIEELEKSLGKGARFECLFLIDDFCGSGRTILREFASVRLKSSIGKLSIPQSINTILSYDEESQELKLVFGEYLSEAEEDQLLSVSDEESYQEGIIELIKKHRDGTTQLAGSLTRVIQEVEQIISPDTNVFLCPLVTTQYALNRLTRLVKRLKHPFDELQLLPSAVLPESIRVQPSLPSQSPTTIATLCETYYRDELADEHTGSIKYGYDNCGLPVVLHHNTPNNSIYLLWSRRLPDPLFVRYERHGREVA